MQRYDRLSTSEAVREAAADLFSAQGYEATSLREVANCVGIQVGSLYNHIEGKEELLSRIMLEIMEELLGALRATVAGRTDPTEALRAAIDCHIRFHANRARDVFIGNSELRALSHENRRMVVQKRREYESLLSELIARAVQATGADVVDVKLQTFAVVAIGVHVSMWYRESGPLPLDAVVDGYTGVIFRQLGLDWPGTNRLVDARESSGVR